MNKKQILIIEDSDEQAAYYKRLLHQQYECITFNQANPAIDFLISNATKPDLILVDYYLPDINGIAFISTIKSHNINIPVIIISASEKIATVIEAMRSGAADFVTKSIELPDVLPLVVEKAIKNDEIKRDKEVFYQEMLQNQAKLSALISSIDELIIEFDETNCILNLWNSNRTIFPFKTNDIIGKKIEEIIEEEKILEKFRQNINEVIATKIKRIFEFYKVIDINIFWFEVSISPLIELEKNPKKYIALIKDITTTKNTLITLQEREALLSEAQKVANIASWSYTIATDKIECSNQMYLIFELPISAELSIENFLKHVYPDDVKELTKAFENINTTPSNSFSYDFRILTASNQTKYIFLKAIIERDENSLPIRLYGILQDVTDRVKTLDSLQESEKLLLETQEIAHVGSWEYDPINQELTFSEEAFRISGLNKTDTPPSIEEYLKIIHPEDRKVLFRSLQKIIKEGTPYEIQLRHITSDGTFRYAITKAIPKFSNGKVIKIRGSLLDITNLKLAEEELLNERNRQKALLDNIPHLAWLKDKEHRYIAVNNRVLKACNLKLEEIIGKSDIEIWNNELARQYYADDVHVVKTKQPLFIEEQIVDNGELKWFETYKTPVFDKQGECIGTAGLAQDIADRKKHQEKIIQQSRLLEGITASLNLLLTTTDYQTAINNAIENFAKATDTLHIFLYQNNTRHGDITNNWSLKSDGFSRPLQSDELFETTWHQFKFSSNIWIDELLSSSFIIRFENQLTPFDCETFGIKQGKSLLLIPIYVLGKFWGFVRFDNCLNGKTLSDYELSIIKAFAAALGGTISRSKNEEKMFKALKIAERANKTKSEFLANMSHEIRTPLNAIKGFNDFMILIEKDAKKLEYLEIVRQNILALSDILNDILDFSKIESGSLTLEHVGFDLEKLMNNLEKTFSFQCKKKGIGLKHFIDKGVPTKIVGDPLRLRQILINLIGNAIKFTEHGEVSFFVTQEFNMGTAYLKFSVKDSGIGISVSDQRRLFRKFTQADSSTTRRYGGTGLGLAISKNLVKMMGGDIAVESEQGKGSIFYFTLPLQIASEDQIIEDKYLPDVEESETIGKEIKILLVEDNEYNQKLAQLFLEKHHYHVLVAANGKEAIEMVQKEPVHLILMDLQMPIMDGFEACKQIRIMEKNQENKVQIPIIALSADALLETRNRAMAAGMNDFISKPFDFKDLINKIELNLKSIETWKQTPIIVQEQEIKPVESEKMLNLDYLNSLAGKDTSFVKTLLETFIEFNPPLIQQMIAAYATKDLTQVGKIAHKMKSSFASLGMGKIAHILANIEKIINISGDNNELKESIEQIDTLTKQAFAEIEEWLNLNKK